MRKEIIMEFIIANIGVIASIISMVITALTTILVSLKKKLDMRPAQLTILRDWSERRRNYNAYRLFVLIVDAFYNILVLLIVLPSDFGTLFYNKCKYSIIVAMVVVVLSVVVMYVLLFLVNGKTQISAKKGVTIIIGAHVSDAISLVAINALVLEKNLWVNVLIVLYGMLMGLLLTMIWDSAIVRPLYSPDKARGWVEYKGEKLYILDVIEDNYLLGENAYITKNASIYCISKSKVHNLKICIDQMDECKDDKSMNNTERGDSGDKLQESIGIKKADSAKEKHGSGRKRKPRK